jgi:crotonobetainyl-CoA:carnitine CoA-transferase CaiB-like acyl-CoA transferase
MPGFPAADIVAGLQGLAGILMALLRRESSGRGDYLDISMFESLLSAMPNILGPALAQDRQPIPAHERTTGGSALYQLYATRDGRHIVLAGQEMKFVHALLQALGRPDFASLCERGPGPHQQPLIDFLRDTFRQKTRAEWDLWAAAHDICYGAVNTLPEALADNQLLARQMVRTDELGRRYLATPIRFGEEPGCVDAREPALGENNPEIPGNADTGRVSWA